jgi:predicted TIM-barrel fold metal-dependent hydrolase
VTESKENQSETPIPLCDPHFHMWDLPRRPNPNLGPDTAAHLPTYLALDYARDMGELPAPLKLVSGVHVETLVGQMEGGFPLDTVDETRWVCAELEPTAAERQFGVVAYVHLARDTAAAERVIQQHIETSGGRLRGVRMILNHHPDNPDLTWPQVESGALLRSPILRQGLALLERHNLSFDLSCNPHQVADAVEVLRDFPALRVVVNHLGFLHDGEDEAHERLWRDGMGALAALPNIYMKLSMPWFARDGFHRDAKKEAKVRDLVLELIATFGCDRCMFASNYPVDKIKDISIADLYSKFLQWSAERSDAERAALFHDTATRAYNLS